MVNHLNLSLLLGAVVVLMMAIFVNYTERLILQFKEDVEKSFLITGHVINGEIKRVIEEISKLKTEVEKKQTRIEKLLETEATEIRKLKKEVEEKQTRIEKLLETEATRIEKLLETEATEIEKLKTEVKEKQTRIVKLLETEATEKPIDCTDINVNQGSGIYNIYPIGKGSFKVYCDMETNNTEGAWTVFQRRKNGEEDFNRGWIDYENGFGNLQKEFWLGNSNLNIITAQGRYELLVMIEDFENSKAFARYNSFKIGDKFSNYKLSIGEYSGTAGNIFEKNNNKPFSTKDKHNVKCKDLDCAKYVGGSWWLTEETDYTRTNLNGMYSKEKSNYFSGIYWLHEQTLDILTLKQTTMMIRRIL